MDKPNLTVTIVGGAHSGKSALAESITTHIKRNKLYGVQLIDHEEVSKPTTGPVKVQVQTIQHDDVLDEGVTMTGPEGMFVRLADLKAVFIEWLDNQRKGVVMPEQDFNALPLGQAAEGQARYLFAKLRERTSK